MDTVTIYGHNLRQEQKDNNINCLKKKFFPNYVFIILIAVSVASIISTIAVAVTKSDSSSEEKKANKMDIMIFPHQYRMNHGKNIKKLRNIYISGNIILLIILLICAKSIILLEYI